MGGMKPSTSLKKISDRGGGGGGGGGGGVDDRLRKCRPNRKERNANTKRIIWM